MQPINLINYTRTLKLLTCNFEGFTISQPSVLSLIFTLIVVHDDFKQQLIDSEPYSLNFVVS